ncbi:MAG: hypothetical protein IBX60_08570 [Candidatus Aminicenantes bacterium]|nr:hypothetical protein [Candidatus Aminicenantes bacterium]
MKGQKTRTFILFAVCLLIFSQFIFAKIDPQFFSALKARSIGPANMSGRIGAVDAVVSNPNIIYVGAATGGLWKSIDGGITWTPIFDEQQVSSIGAIAINQHNPNIVWVGTGEAAPRNSVGVGRGVYLTVDGGKTWKFLGLEKTEKISKILLHPDNPDIAYVGAVGTTWGENPERGVYKTVDGGKTWKKILYVNEKTGVGDMDMDPGNPNKIIVAMWQHRRWPWFFESGGPGSGLYITVNGGEEWQRLTDKDGLPKGELGRTGIAFSPGKPEIVYALVEAEKSVLLRSINGGYNWEVVNNQPGIHNRPFYYSRIWVNPVNENILYMLHTQLMVSEDAGKTFKPLASFGQSHSDYHAMWIHPDGEMMVVGNDGGVVISYHRGKSWRFVENLPLGQFYHISFDMEIPYNVYGGLQDNGSWRGPAYVLKERAIYSYLWKNVGGGDGFDTEPDPENSKAGYGMSQGGNLYYFDISTGTSRNIVPTESDVKHRYNWNAGFAVDSFKPATIYLGSQFVHRSTDKGRTWEIISPDLTTNDPEKQKQTESGGLTLDVTNAENHCTIMCIAPSPVKEGIIWVGTDDGNIQLTRDGGKTWELVSKSLTTGGKGKVPAAAWVSHVEASKFDAATAYVTFDDHRRSNWTTYVYVTHDYGKTWKSLVTPEIDGFVHVIEEDTVNKNLLFLGTEFGLFVSFNGGENWMKWTHGVPTVPVRDLAVHTRENDLIIGTHGRSIYIIDDISPLREISEALIQKKLHLFEVPDAYQYQQGRLSSFMSPGDTAFAGENKRTGACFTYYLIPSEPKKDESKTEPGDPMSQQAGRMSQAGGVAQFRRMGMMGPSSSRVSIEILDSQGKVVSQFNGTENKGINRVYWNFREQLPGTEEQMQAERFAFRRGGLMVLPGEYTVKVKYDSQEVSKKFTVKSDPRLKVDIEVLKENYKEAKAAQQLSMVIMEADRQIQETQKAIKTISEYARTNRTPKTRDLMKAGRELDGKLKKLSETLNPVPPKQGIADRSAGLRSQVMRAVMMVMGSGYDPISQAAKVKYQKVTSEVEAFLEGFNRFYQTDVEEFKKLVVESGFSLFKPFKPLKLENK